MWKVEGSHKSDKVIFSTEDDLPVAYLAINKEHGTMENAHKIAAAPEMYEALKIAREYIYHAKQNGMIGEIDKDLALIEAALLKSKPTSLTLTPT